MRTRVKTFLSEDRNARMVEQEANEWLAAHDGKIEVIQIDTTIWGDGTGYGYENFIITVLYRELEQVDKGGDVT
jgi:hypothetical protein